jgi:hypothetical protein
VKRFVSVVVVDGLFCCVALATARTAVAESPKPLVVLSLSSYNALVGESAPVGKVADVKGMPTWLAATLKLYGEGRDLDSLDPTRPWGAVVQREGELSAYAFAPVKDAEQLAWDLDEFIESPSDVGEGVYEIVAREGGKKLYTTESAGWVFVSDKAETLHNLPDDPAKLLGGLNKQYDVALQFELHNVPAENGKKMLARLDEHMGEAARRITSDQTVEMLGKILFELDQVTLGWTRHGSK